MTATVILNQRAGALLADTGEFGPGRLSRAFSQVGIEATVRVASGPEIVDAVRQAVAATPDAVVVGGGDGTLGAIAGVVAASPVPLGVLPLGTLNHFAKDLGIPADWKMAIATIAEQNLRTVDLAEVNGKIFINNCSLGAYPEAVRRREALRQLHGLKKWTAMALASLQVVRRLRRMRLTIVRDGQTVTRRAPFVLIANNRYSGNLFARSLRPRLNGGELWGYSTHVHRIFPLLRLMLQSLTRSMEQAEELEAWPAREMTIWSRGGPIPVAADGEVLDLEAPLRFRIRPGALWVFGPSPAA
jgi:diacylglycerol kinase family enzyme